MKSAVAAFASVVLGVCVGWAALGFFAPRGFAGRDITPLVIFAAIFLVGSGLVYGRVWLRGTGECMAGLAAYALVVGVIVRFFAGGDPRDEMFFDWFVLVLVVTLVPWLAGMFAGKWSRRFQLTP